MSCTREQTYEPQPVFATAGAGFAVRPVRDFLIAQGTYCPPDGSGGCELIRAPVPNYLCWCDPGTGWMASVDYAGVAETWLHQESRGALSCGTACRGQVIEVPQPDGSARVSVILEAKNAMAWADKERPNLRMGTPADVVLRGKVPTLGSTKLELEFSIPEAGAPLPDLMQLIYDPAPGQVLHRLRFHGQAEGVLRGKATLMEIVQTGISPTLPSSSMTDGLPAEITFTKLVNRIR